MSSNWTSMRKSSLRKMQRYAAWKRHVIEQLRNRLLNTMRRRLKLNYTLLATPKFKSRRAA